MKLFGFSILSGQSGTLKNIELTKGLCWRCGKRVASPKWTDFPILGDPCRECGHKTRPFSLENICLHWRVERNPYKKDGSLHFNFEHTEILVNGVQGVLLGLQADSAVIQFAGAERGDSVAQLGYWYLMPMLRDEFKATRPLTYNLFRLLGLF